jgi:predicted NBD/HSP70 family sugar kinase
LVKRFEVPIVIENDVNLAALGEMWFGTQDDVSNLILLTIGTGVGAGVIINGAVYSGSHNMAGEVGYFLPDRNHLGRSYPDFGAIEQLISGIGIASRASRVLASMRTPAEVEALTVSDVFDAVRCQEPWVQGVFDETVDYLALLIAGLTTLYDPDVILLGGGLARFADLLIEPIYKRLEGTLLLMPSIRASQLGYRAAILGAIIRLLRITNNYYVLQKFV